ncbi:chorismate-binding protein, partial [Dietzia sp.]|uniref:chorismate-binding protein n=1 Tax=Dietzia sp. TaxID=1871616 RepID=UPI002FDB3E5D
VDAAYDDAVDRVDEMARQLSEPARPMVAEFDMVEPEVRRQRSVEEYMQIVRDVVEEIKAGEAFQVVPSQRFEVDTAARPRDVYRVLRTINPSPYMYLLNFPDGSGDDGFGATAFSVVGSSPEALVTVQGGEATMHPIAGSRPRGSTEVEDLRLEEDLLEDEKENAEHLMLVDLARNDLGRVSTPGTVSVASLLHVERYSHIMHLVSNVQSSLAAGKTALDAVLSTFPAGTLSGSPKPRALEIIEEQEATRRGVYGGTVGYFDFAGNSDLAIAIRTALIKDGTAYVQAGAGVVADSDPATEEMETQNKAGAVLRAVAAAGTMRPAGDVPEEDRR